MENITTANTGARKFSSDDKDAGYVALIMVFALLLGGLFVVFGLPTNAGGVWAGLLWAAAWSSVGWFLGFLFGIPRSLSTDTARTSTQADPDASRNALKAAFDKASIAFATAKKSSEELDAVVLEREKDLRKAIDAEKSASDAATANPIDQNLANLAKAAKTTLTRVSEASQEAASATKIAAQVTKARSDDLSTAEAAMKSGRGASFLPERNPEGRTAPSTAVNTNLEQISDWLTKIIVGVTLVESKAVISQMGNAAELMATSLGGQTFKSFAFAILIYFSVTGLLGSYLLTRLFLQAAFTNAAAGNGARD